MYPYPPSSLYDTLWEIAVPGAPCWRYDGQFIWLPMPQMGYEKGYTNG